MTILAFAGIVLFVFMFGVALWTLRYQRRMYPPGARVAGERDERNRGLRWIGFIYGGGRG